MTEVTQDKDIKESEKRWHYHNIKKDVVELTFDFWPNYKINIQQYPKIQHEYHGAVIWKVAIPFCEWLAKTENWTNKNVLELGTGTGIVGIVLGLLGADITITDFEELLDLVYKNVEDIAPQCNITILPYIWGQNPKQNSLCIPYETVICSDLMFYKDSYPDLLKSLIAVTNLESNIYIAYTKRTPDEELVFFKEFVKYFEFSMISEEEIHPQFLKSSNIVILKAKKKAKPDLNYQFSIEGERQFTKFYIGNDYFYF